MKYLHVSNWDRWQSYRKDRGAPPWIKIHRKILSNPEWAILTDAEKGQLLSIWIVAADNDGKIPCDGNILRKICQLDEVPDTKKLTTLGFLLPSDANVTTKRQPSDPPEERREEKRREEESRGTFSNVFLTEKEYENIKIKFNSSTEEKINSLSEYMKSKGKRYKSHYATILTWARKDQVTPGQNKFAGAK